MYLCAQDGWTALHLAAQEGKVDVMKLLTEAQAQVNIRTKVKWIPTLTTQQLISDKMQCPWLHSYFLVHM